MEQSDYNIISYNSCSDLGKRINYSSLIVGLAMIAFALWLLFFLNVDNPKSNMNIFRLVAGWMLASIGIVILTFKLRRWVYMPTLSNIRKASYDYPSSKFGTLRRLLASHAGIEKVNISDSSNIRIDCLYSDDGEFVALQAIQYSPFGDKVLTYVIYLYGIEATDFIRAINNIR